MTKNVYGNIDVSKGVPDDCVHIDGKRLAPLCRKLGIEFAPAVVGFTKAVGRWRPIRDGVVVYAKDAEKLRIHIAAREKRNQPRREQHARRRAARAEEFAERCHDLGIFDPCGRTAKALKQGRISDDEAAFAAFKTALRHEHTDYDDLLAATRDREYARDQKQEIDSCAETWEAYLQLYPFPYPETARAIAAALESPQNAHPIWFCEAVIAVKSAELRPESLSYETIKSAIERWRRDREDVYHTSF